MNKKDLNRIFNMNNILTQVISFGAYIFLIISALILVYLSFVESFDFQLDWRTIGIFSVTTVALAWSDWNVFYRKLFEKTLGDDIEQQEINKYSIHSRYYMATKDWSDADLQMAIDKFNEEYTNKWLRSVERKTGKPIHTIREVYIDPETFEETVIETKGIIDLPYKGFKYKKLMKRIKTHNYPESGYKSSMELLSLLSYQDANFNKRDLRADKKFYMISSIRKLINSALVITVGASLVPEMIKGDWWIAILKLILALGTLAISTFMGSMSGVRGARKKLSIVEDTCADLERWAEKKPILTPYKEPAIVPMVTIKNEIEPEIIDVTKDIFHKPNILGK